MTGLTEKTNWLPLESHPESLNPYLETLGVDTSKA